MAFDSKALNNAQSVRHLLNAADSLDEAGKYAVAAKDDPLFKQIHEQRMALWNLVCAIMQGEVKARD
jgi:hypothetical protein